MTQTNSVRVTRLSNDVRLWSEDADAKGRPHSRIALGWIPGTRFNPGVVFVRPLIRRGEGDCAVTRSWCDAEYRSGCPGPAPLTVAGGLHGVTSPPPGSASHSASRRGGLRTICARGPMEGHRNSTPAYAGSSPAERANKAHDAKAVTSESRREDNDLRPTIPKCGDAHRAPNHRTRRLTQPSSSSET